MTDKGFSREKQRAIDLITRNVDVVLIVNKNFEIIYCSRFDKHLKYNKSMIFPNKVMGMNLFDLYPTLTLENSSIARTMSTGEVIVNDVQKVSDKDGKVYVTQNMTMPLFSDGIIAGVIELTKDLTNAEILETKKEFFDRIAAEPSFRSNREANDKISFDDILTLDDEMKRAIEVAKVFSKHPTPTLIYGETGTGKELFAQSIMNYAALENQKIIVQNCAAVPENLIESILFGTVKGAFTGAENKKGLFEEADGGFFFLDELSALPYGVQGKLLRVIQDGTFRPIGSNQEKKVRVKIIAAMNIDPMEAIESNVLRKDLFYRLSSNMIFIPPLRERKGDIEYLTEKYIDLFNELYGKNVKGISDELRDLFMNYTWEGNVRELKHTVESMVGSSRGEVLEADEIPLYLHRKMNLGEAEDTLSTRTAAEMTENGELSDNEKNTILPTGLNLVTTMEDMEKKLIIQALDTAKGNITKAGELLGIPRQTLKYKMIKFEINVKGE